MPATRLLIDKHPILDMHLFLRALAGNLIRESDATEPFSEAIRLYQQIGLTFPPTVSGSLSNFEIDNQNSAEVREYYWRIVDGLIARLSGFDDIERGLIRFPTSISAWATEDTRDHLLRALVVTHPYYQKSFWPEQEREIEREIEAVWRRHFTPKEAEFNRQIEEAFLLEPTTYDGLRVVWVSVAPPPGGIMYRVPAISSEGKAILGHTIVAGLNQLQGLLLLEATVHELIHRCNDLQPRRSGNLLASIRQSLTEARVVPSLRRNVPHALIFMESASLVRKNVDPAHRGLDERLRRTQPGFAEIVDSITPAWQQYRTGQVSAKDLVDTLTERIKKLPPRA